MLLVIMTFMLDSMLCLEGKVYTRKVIVYKWYFWVYMALKFQANVPQ